MYRYIHEWSSEDAAASEIIMGELDCELGYAEEIAD